MTSLTLQDFEKDQQEVIEKTDIQQLSSYCLELQALEDDISSKEEETKKLDDKNRVVLQDEHGYYTTEKSRIDSGLADPNRYDSSRLMWYKKQHGNNNAS